jgi:ABC-2 type transport system ATP-binding protein
VGEALYASFYPRPAPWREVMARVGLDAKEWAAFGKLSDGQQQRVSIALALLGEPELVVLGSWTTDHRA